MTESRLFSGDSARAPPYVPFKHTLILWTDGKFA